MNNKKDRIDLNNTFRKTQKKINGKKHTCLYLECSNKAISSHSQQEKRSLKSIAKNGHVYALNADFGHSYNFKTDDYKLSFKLTGIGQASTFSGFCSKHEDIFKIFEDNGLDIKNNDHISRLHYRTLMYNYSQTRKEIERIKLDKPQAIKTFEKIDLESFLNKKLKELEIHLLNVKNQADKVIIHINNNDKNFLSSIGFEIKRNIGISCSNSSILNDNNPGNNPTFSFNVLPDIDSTVVVMSWLRVHDSHARWWIGIFKEDIELFVNLLSFYLTEDICINPDLWDSNINNIQDEVKETRHLSDPLFFETIGFKKILEIPELNNINWNNLT